ncbi:hypothetical protein AWV80_34915 [Cupriavidus sp. UYMU48A]|nr:hypothetical protein AWV80_34915 [Cupriavidus sp. UYMU48A]
MPDVEEEREEHIREETGLALTFKTEAWGVASDLREPPSADGAGVFHGRQADTANAMVYAFRLRLAQFTRDRGRL